jgi:hypothetical protein
MFMEVILLDGVHEQRLSGSTTMSTTPHDRQGRSMALHIELSASASASCSLDNKRY